MPVTDTRTSQEVFLAPNRAPAVANKEDAIPKFFFEEYRHIVVKNNRVMVAKLPMSWAKKYKGSIILEGGNKDFTAIEGVVVAVGEGSYLPNGELVAPTYQVGDVVAFSEGSGVDFKIRRPDSEQGFEEVKLVDCNSIYFVDGTGHELYETT